MIRKRRDTILSGGMNNPDYSLLQMFEYLFSTEERKQSRQVLFPKVKIFFPSLKASLKSADRGVLKISLNRNYIEEEKKKHMIYLLDRRM